MRFAISRGAFTSSATFLRVEQGLDIKGEPRRKPFICDGISELLCSLYLQLFVKTSRLEMTQIQGFISAFTLFSRCAVLRFNYVLICINRKYNLHYVYCRTLSDIIP